MGMPFATADDIRTAIRSQHGGLRVILKDLADAAARVRAVGSDRRLLPLLEQLLHDLANHMTYEELTLVPALRERDPLGTDRGAAILEEHARQRAELTAMAREAAAGHDQRDLAAAVQSFVTDVLVDMAHEERSYLCEDVLHDDLIVAGQSDG
jgi:hypothetical protein